MCNGDSCKRGSSYLFLLSDRVDVLVILEENLCIKSLSSWEGVYIIN